jgi:DNA-binding transcriptional regulator YiaG
MTSAEFKQAHAELGLTGVEIARALDVTDRTVRAWEAGMRDGKPAPIPKAIAVLVRLALRHANVRRELGIASKA